MKRLKLIVGLALFVFLFSGTAFASDFVFTQAEALNWSTEVIDNTTGDYQTTNVAITTIIPAGTNSRSRILGYAVMSLTGHAGITGNSENVASLWDEIAGTIEPMMFDEAESLDGSFDGRWFPTPKLVVNGLTVRQGANTRVIIYYE